MRTLFLLATFTLIGIMLFISGCCGVLSTPKYLDENINVSKSDAYSYCNSKVDECTEDIPAVRTQYKMGCLQLYEYTAGSKDLISYGNSLCAKSPESNVLSDEQQSPSEQPSPNQLPTTQPKEQPKKTQNEPTTVVPPQSQAPEVERPSEQPNQIQNLDAPQNTSDLIEKCGNYNNCNQIQDSDLKSKCFSNSLYTYLNKEKVPSDGFCCFGIVSENEQDSCLNIYLDSTYNYYLADVLSIYNSYINTNDKTKSPFCEAIINVSTRDKCFSQEEIIQYKNRMCNLIKNDSLREKCALKEGSCDLLKNQSLKDQCIYDKIYPSNESLFDKIYPSNEILDSNLKHSETGLEFQGSGMFTNQYGNRITPVYDVTLIKVTKQPSSTATRVILKDNSGATLFTTVFIDNSAKFEYNLTAQQQYRIEADNFGLEYRLPWRGGGLPIENNGIAWNARSVDGSDDPDHPQDLGNIVSIDFIVR